MLLFDLKIFIFSYCPEGRTRISQEKGSAGQHDVLSYCKRKSQPMDSHARFNNLPSRGAVMATIHAVIERLRRNDPSLTTLL